MVVRVYTSSNICTFVREHVYPNQNVVFVATCKASIIHDGAQVSTGESEEFLRVFLLPKVSCLFVHI